MDPNTMLAVGLTGAKHYHTVWNPVKRRYQRYRNPGEEEDESIMDRHIADEKGYVLKRRSEVGSDEEVVEVVRHRGQVLPRRPGYARRSSSMDNPRNGAMVPYRGGGGRDENDGAMVPYKGGRRGAAAGGGAAGYGSEGSPSPRNRGRAKSQSGQSQKNRNRSKSSSSSLCSSSEDERNIKKMQRKKWLTAGLASVATIHAASKVYSSIESHDKRMAEVREGKMTPEEAHKKARSARWQDAAAIGIAALGIKGAMSEWGEMQEEHMEHRKLMEEREEHHKKRLEQERRRRAKQMHGYYKGRDGQWYYDGPEEQYSARDARSRGGRGSSSSPDRRQGRNKSRNRNGAVSRRRSPQDPNELAPGTKRDFALGAAGEAMDALGNA